MGERWISFFLETKMCICGPFVCNCFSLGAMSIVLTFKALLLIYFHFISHFQSSPSLSSPPCLLLNPEVLKVYTFPEVLRFHGAIFVD